jgi:hypothetical protein
MAPTCREELATRDRAGGSRRNSKGRHMSAQTESSQKDRRRKLEAGLDEALAQTFPASDPFSVGRSTGTEPPSRPVDRRAPRIVQRKAEVRERGRKPASRRVEG